MDTSPKNSDDKGVPPKTSTVLLLMSTIGDTTWRLFVPSIGFTILGLALDKQFGTTPWFMIIGIVLGITIAVLLVRLQMKKVTKL